MMLTSKRKGIPKQITDLKIIKELIPKKSKAYNPIINKTEILIN